MLLCVVPTPPIHPSEYLCYGEWKRLRRPEPPLLAGRYVARVSHRILQTDASILRLRSKLALKLSKGTASVSFNLSNVSLFVNNFINN